MKKALFLLSTLILALGFYLTPSEAASTAQEEEIKAIVTQVLKDNPQIIIDALENFRTQKQAELQKAQQELLKQLDTVLLNTKPLLVAGNPKGDVTIIEFFDYQCGYCKKAFPELMKVAEEDKNIRIIFKEFPVLGPASEEAARLALAVHLEHGDKTYLKFHTALMEHKGRLTSEVLEGITKDLKLDYNKLSKQAKESQEITAAIGTARAIAGQLQIQGTPGFIIGGTIVPGYVPAEQLKEIVKTERAKRKG